MPPRLYSSGGETQASAANVQATPVPGVDGLIQSLNTFASEQLQKSVAETKGRITDLASKAQQDMQLKGGDNYLLAETPRFASAEFYNTYERASRKVLLEEMKNDVRDLALQAMNTETTFSDPKAFEAAYKQQYTMMRDKVMVNAEFTRDFVPELDEVFRENLTNFGYEVSARQMNWMRQDIESRVDANYQGWAEATRDRMSGAGVAIKKADDYEKEFYKQFEGVEDNAKQLLDPAWSLSPADKHKRVMKLKDDLSEDFMNSALTSMLSQGKFGEFNKLIDRNAKGELFRENPSLRPKLGGADGKVRQSLDYFIKQVTDAVARGETLPDIAKRFSESQDPDTGWFAGAVSGLIGPDGRTNRQAIRDLFEAQAALDPKWANFKRDYEASIFLGDVVNTKLSQSPEIAMHIARSDAAGGLDITTEKVGENTYKLYIAGQLVTPTAVGLDEDSSESALVKAVVENTDPVFKQQLVRAVKKRSETVVNAYSKAVSDGDSATEAYFKLYPARQVNPATLPNFDQPARTITKPDVDKAASVAAAELADSLGDSVTWASQLPGQNAETIALKPMPKRVTDTYTESINSALTNGNAPLVNHYFETLAAYGRNHGAGSAVALQQLPDDLRALGTFALAIDDPVARNKFLMNIGNSRGAVATVDAATLGAVNSKIQLFLMNSADSSIQKKLRAMTGGNNAMTQHLVKNVILPLLSVDAITKAAGTEGKELASMLDTLLNAENVKAVFNSMGTVTSVNLGGKMFETMAPEYEAAAVQEAISASYNNAEPGRKAVLQSSVPVVMTNEQGSRVIRWVPRAGSTTWVRKGGVGSAIIETPIALR